MTRRVDSAHVSLSERQDIRPFPPRNHRARSPHTVGDTVQPTASAAGQGRATHASPCGVPGMVQSNKYEGCVKRCNPPRAATTYAPRPIAPSTDATPVAAARTAAVTPHPCSAHAASLYPRPLCT